MAFLLVKFDLNPWLVLAVGVPGSALGRYLFSLYIPRFSKQLISKAKNDEMQWVGKKLKGRIWSTWAMVFGYSVSPLSTTVLFTAAGMTKVPVMHVLPPFFAGKFISDTVMVMAGRYAAPDLEGLFHGTLGWKSVLTGAIAFLITGAFLFVDWHALIAKKRFRLNFSIWR
jgi:membrane protein DedA with SNARE-associated domain